MGLGYLCLAADAVRLLAQAGAQGGGLKGIRQRAAVGKGHGVQGCLRSPSAALEGDAVVRHIGPGAGLEAAAGLLVGPVVCVGEFVELDAVKDDGLRVAAQEGGDRCADRLICD